MLNALLTQWLSSHQLALFQDSEVKTTVHLWSFIFSLLCLVVPPYLFLSLYYKKHSNATTVTEFPVCCITLIQCILFLYRACLISLFLCPSLVKGIPLVVRSRPPFSLLTRLHLLNHAHLYALSIFENKYLSWLLSLYTVPYI